MLRKFQAKRREDEGFTLIELMVVVLIIAILIAIAIPTFLGARQRAQDKAAQSSLRNAMTAAKTNYTDSESYALTTAGATLADLAAVLEDIEPSLTFTDVVANATDDKVVAILQANADTITMVSQSDANNCFYIYDDVTGPGTRFEKAAPVAGVCPAAPANPGTWPTKW